MLTYLATHHASQVIHVQITGSFNLAHGRIAMPKVMAMPSQNHTGGCHLLLPCTQNSLHVCIYVYGHMCLCVWTHVFMCMGTCAYVYGHMY